MTTSIPPPAVPLPSGSQSLAEGLAATSQGRVGGPPKSPTA
jgi:hypothetical protein